MLKRNKGITLIALVVTIIILLILAGVTLSLVAGENGIPKRATEAVDINEKVTAEEEANLLIADLATQYYEEKYVNQKEVGELDEYLRKELQIEKHTPGGYIVMIDEEEKVTVSKEGKLPISIGEIENGRVNWLEDEAETIVVPEILENPTFSYDSTTAVESLTVKIIYPKYARLKEYKIGIDGEWKTYKNDIILVENTTISARYTAIDARKSEEISETIENISQNILKYTNAEAYMNASYIPKIESVKYLFDKSKYNIWDLNSGIPNFVSWCSEEVYFQNNKLEPVTVSKVTIVSTANNSGFEPIRQFYITASNTIDFSEEVELYRGEHDLNNKVADNNYGWYESEHQFEPKGSYQFYRLYITSWWPMNGGNGQNVAGCYIE